MKTTIRISVFAFALALLPVVNAAAQTSSKTVIKPLASAIQWKNDQVEVGEIPQNIPKPITFELKNTGKTDILITNVKPTCGCTVADYTKTAIRPGETATVNATFSAANKGPFTKTITVTTTASEEPKLLTFKGTVL